MEEDIQSVEEQIEKCRNIEERMQLWQMKARHREEEAQLLQGRGVYTEYDWLRQDLPSRDPDCCSKTPSSTQEERMHTPVNVDYWDVEKDIEDYVNKADNMKRRFEKVDTLPRLDVRGRRMHGRRIVAGSVVAAICDFVSKKQAGSSVMYEPKVRLEVPPIPLAEEGNSANSDESRSVDKEVLKALYYAKPPRADILVTSNDKEAAVFVLKSGGLECPVCIHKLWTRCSCRTGRDSNCWCNSGITKGQARSLLNCILQLYESLVLAKVGYGVLTDLQNWYFFKRDRTGCLYISTIFKWNNKQQYLIAAVAYLINTSVLDGGEYDISPKKGARPWSWEATACTSPSVGSKDDEDKDRTYEPNENEIGGCERSAPRTREAYSKQFHEIPASNLHLDDRPITSSGWSGCVAGGFLNGRRVAVKFAPRESERAEFLLNEVIAYLKLQEHWGVFVPPLIGYGTTANGRVVYIATELIDGSPLGRGTVTEEVATAALQALDAVHACKLLHGDVEARNIIVVRGTQPSVRLVNFGLVQEKHNWNSRKSELRTLQRLLKDMMGVGVGKESDGARYPHK